MKQFPIAFLVVVSLTAAGATVHAIEGQDIPSETSRVNYLAVFDSSGTSASYGSSVHRLWRGGVQNETGGRSSLT